MAGYSGTPLPRKLGIKPDNTVALVGAPDGFPGGLGELPSGVAFIDDSRSRINVAVLFVTSAADLRRTFLRLARRLTPAGGLWVAWPKRSSGVSTDLTENVIREYGLSTGLVDNKVCAIDEMWSGLRFVIRVEDRPKTARSKGSARRE